MDKGLTLAVMLFLLLVYLPGYTALSVAGRKREERTIPFSLQYGVLMLALTLSISFLLELTGRINIFSRFISALREISSLEKKPIDIIALADVFALSYFVAIAGGVIELLGVIGFPCKRKERLRIKPVDPLRETFIRYRKAGKRPYLRVTLSSGEIITGECLKYGWNGEESILIRDAANISSLVWVPLKDATKIEFRNLLAVREKANEWIEIEKNRKILNGIADGYGDEVYGKAR
ncbi:hypothetical protein [Neomoorella thermoacetica]|uniref:hypothetical protein n=1 Tax=Neomoorella thermoacetica TaxID=1525 RepID=UPI0008FB2E4B|nr:hypothetical protein [Moorella thermoacetica]OIQ53427.1 hypothetical protein MORE_21550 [Moorella thermoacetica]